MVLQLIVFLYAAAGETQTHDENATQHHSAEQHSVEPSQTLSSKDTVTTQHDPPPDELSNSVQARDDLIDEEHMEVHPAWNFMQEDDSLNSTDASGNPYGGGAQRGVQGLNTRLNTPTIGTGQGLNTRTTLPNAFGQAQAMNPALQNQFRAPGSAVPATNPFASFVPATNRLPNVSNLNGIIPTPNPFGTPTPNPFGTPTPNGFPNGLPSTLGQVVQQRRGGQINFCMPASLLPALLNQFLCLLPTLLQTQTVTQPAPPPPPVMVPVPVPNPVQVRVPNPVPVPVPNPIPVPVRVPVPVPNPVPVRAAGLMATPQFSSYNMGR